MLKVNNGNKSGQPEPGCPDSEEEMNEQSFAKWLTAYGQAWETRDPEAAMRLFTEDARYYETPFTEPFVGQAAIRDYWADVPQLQTEIEFRYEILSVKGIAGIARWQAAFKRIKSGHRVQLDGILVITVDDAVRCRLFQEWWHRQEEDAS